MLVSQAVGETLRRVGVDTAFGLIGSGNFAIVTHMTTRCGIRYYGARHELGAIVMADAYARVTGRVGVCTVHQGPGLTNTMTGLVEATKSRTPLLVVAGDTASTARGGNLDIDQDTLVRSIGAGVHRVRGAELAVEDVALAVRRAWAERRPIVLSLPIDLQEQDCPGPDQVEPSLGPPLPPVRPHDEAVSGVVDLLARSSRPLIIAGRGAVRADARQPLEELGDRAGAILATSAVAHGLFAGNVWNVGIAGGFSSPLAVRLIAEADLVLAFGASLNYWTTRHGRLLPPAPIVQCDVDPAAIGANRPVRIGLVGDAGATATALVDEMLARGMAQEGYRSESTARELAAYRRASEIDDAGTEETVDPRSVMAALDLMLPAERTVAIDSGHFMGFPAMYLSVPDAAGFVMTQAFQSVGLGLASGIGAAVARPDRLAVAVLGDGGLRMSIGEIETAVAHRLPMLIVVMNDAAYGAEVHHFQDLGLETELALLEDRDFAAIAAAMGGRGLTVRSLDDLDGLGGWLDGPEGPMLIDCKVNPRLRAEWLEEAFRPAAA